MPSNPLLGKFGPLVLLAAVQLILVLAAPSTAPNASSTDALAPYGSAPAAGAPVAGAPTYGSTGATGPTGTTSATGTASVSSGAAGTTTGGASASGASANGSSGAAGSGTAQPTGDTKHCVNGLQFSASDFYYAPPCVPGVPGAAFANNGGATWPGVTSKQIEVVNYVADYGAEVNQILRAQGLYYDAATAKKWNAAYEKFINTHYQLYGRQIHVDTWQGKCTTVPPDYRCLIGEMDKLVAQYHPYAVFWETAGLCSQCFAELARLHVVSLGGGGFSDQFHNDNAPYNYDSGMSSTMLETTFADWWCKQMSGKPAIFAGHENAREPLYQSKRILGVTAPNDPDVENTIKNVLYAELSKQCGEKVTHQYFYAQDINTATTQSQQAEQAMNTPVNPATSVLCVCDPVAPQFGLNAYAENNYWPEAVIGANQTMDFDSNGQTYSSDNGGGDTLACPTHHDAGCPWDSATGIGADPLQMAVSKTDGATVYRIGSGDANGPLPIAAATLGIVWDDYGMLANLIENTGPLLTPARMQAAAPNLPWRGGGTTGHPLRGFKAGQWSWTKDVAVIYWNRHAVSPYNGVKGHYIPIEGRRFAYGEFKSMSQPPAPITSARK